MSCLLNANRPKNTNKRGFCNSFLDCSFQMQKGVSNFIMVSSCFLTVYFSSNHINASTWPNLLIKQCQRKGLMDYWFFWLSRFKASPSISDCCSTWDIQMNCDTSFASIISLRGPFSFVYYSEPLCQKSKTEVHLNVFSPWI